MVTSTSLMARKKVADAAKVPGVAQAHPKGDVVTLSTDDRKALREARVKRGLNQGEAADKIGVKQATISNVENGKHTSQVRKSVYAALVRLYKMKVDAPTPTIEHEKDFKDLVAAISDLEPDEYAAMLAVAKTITKPRHSG